MNLYTAVALPLFVLTLQPADAYSKDKHQAPAAWLAPAERSRISFGEGIDLIVKGLGLNIDNIRFIKAPKATDYFKYASNDAPYAPSLIIAANNGIRSGRELRPGKPATRQQFAQALYEAVQSTGQYPTNMMWLNIKDEAAFKGEGLSAVQTLIKFNVVTLEDGNFRPKAYITAAEAKKMVEQAAAFIQSHKERAAAEHADKGAATFISSPINDKVNSIVISAGNQPTSGYQLVITRIDFSAAGEAVIHYKLAAPAEGSMNLQVITEPKAETFISSAYKVVLEEDK